MPVPLIHSQYDEEYPGVLLHSACYQLLQPHISHMSVPELFRFFGSKVDDCSQCVDGVDYGEIQENQGQDYEMVSGQRWMVTCPSPICQVQGIHKNPCGTPPGDFSVLSSDLMCHLLDFFEVEDLAIFGECSKEAYAYSRHETVWNDPDGTSVIENGVFTAFTSDDSKKNFDRIMGIVDQIVKILPKEKKNKRKRTSDDEDGEKDWESMTVNELKDELKCLGLKCTGKKAELIERIKEAHGEKGKKKQKK